VEVFLLKEETLVVREELDKPYFQGGHLLAMVVSQMAHHSPHLMVPTQVEALQHLK
jgi:hypothetical protein